MIAEKIAELINELLDGVDRGEFLSPENIPTHYTFRHLAALSINANLLGQGADLYRYLFKQTTQAALLRVRRQVGKRKIRAAFLLFSAAEWQAQGVYDHLAADPLFDVSVILVPMMDHSRQERITVHDMAMRFFAERGCRVQDAYDVQNDRAKGWDALGERPDMIIHLMPYIANVAEQLSVESFTFDLLNCYIPYGIETAENRENTYMRDVLGVYPFMNLMHRIYTDSKTTRDWFIDNTIPRGSNVVFSGFPKMDVFFSGTADHECRPHPLWKEEIPGANGATRTRRKGRDQKTVVRGRAKLCQI